MTQQFIFRMVQAFFAFLLKKPALRFLNCCFCLSVASFLRGQFIMDKIAQNSVIMNGRYLVDDTFSYPLIYDN